MAIERLPCKTPGCTHTILPDTAARTGGYCMRCVGEQKAAERREFIRNNRREVDRLDGLTDAVAIIRELHTWRKPDPLIVYKPVPITLAGSYETLSAPDQRRLMELAIELRRSGDKDLAERIAKGLATQTDLDLTPLAMAWLDCSDCWPSVLFRNASARVRDRVIALLESWHGTRDESLPVNHALCALAWVADPETRDTFAQWEKHPPVWRQHLYVGPRRYAHTGGWEIGSQAKRSLVHESCLQVAALEDGSVGDAVVSAFVPLEQNCPWCSRPLVSMLTIATTDSRFAFLGWSGTGLSVLTCDVCTCFSAHIFAHAHADGTAGWHAANTPPAHLPKGGKAWDKSPWSGKPLRLSARRPLAAVESDLGVSASAIGGHPSWVQDTAFPKCPDCGQTMLFIAQLDNSDFKHHEGSYYAFFCAPCGVTATCYQQT